MCPQRTNHTVGGYKTANLLKYGKWALQEEIAELIPAVRTMFDVGYMKPGENPKTDSLPVF